MLFTHYGVPEEVLTDCGANFLSRLLKFLYNLMDLYNLMGIRGLKTTPYHPQTDGMFERFNQTMNVMLKKNMATWNSQWDLALPFVLGEYRTTPNATTGFTPSELLQGRQIRTPLKVFKEQWTDPETRPQNVVQYVEELTARFDKQRETAEENECKQKTKHKHHYDQKSVERKFQVGDMELLGTHLYDMACMLNGLVHIRSLRFCRICCMSCTCLNIQEERDSTMPTIWNSTIHLLQSVC